MCSIVQWIRAFGYLTECVVIIIGMQMKMGEDYSFLFAVIVFCAAFMHDRLWTLGFYSIEDVYDGDENLNMQGGYFS